MVNNEKMLIRQKFDSAGFPSPFTNSVIRDYEHKQDRRQQQEDEYIIPPNYFEIPRESMFVKFPYCSQNELVAKRLLSKFHQFTNQKFQITNQFTNQKFQITNQFTNQKFHVTIKWRITEKVKSLFSLKDKNP